MSELFATADAHPNIAFIKYWGNVNDQLKISLNGSISMNLDGLTTRTSVRFDSSLDSDKLEINDQPASPAANQRVTDHLDLIRNMAKLNQAAHVISHSNFPIGSGIASSASAFAALSLAGSKAAGLDLDIIELSRLARRGSGSACRSIPDGITEWHAGTTDEQSFADQLVPLDYWELVDCLIIINEKHKSVSSSDGHRISKTSPIQPLRIMGSARRFELCHNAILNRDFQSFSDVVEHDSNLMHSVMCTSMPSLVYLTKSSFEVIHAVLELRSKAVEACYTIDAGPNVHVITIKHQL
ncbi:MAG: diphosphomevalonate decarboxylase, partial [Anaerolineaceae bacterium]|nr:diphosphomevalonate decarboxylase [Anaerolineaceae bacterium]